MINENFFNMLKQQDADVYSEEPMSKHTTFHIGGNADCFCEVKNISSLKNIIYLCKEYAVPYFIIGLGSNLLVADDGIRGLVIKLGGEFNSITLLEDNYIRCGAGVSLARLCVFARKISLSGVEFAWGIPGSVGGAVYMNAGAYEGEISQIVDSAAYIDSNGNSKKYSGNELKFSYRNSVFTNTDNIITDVTFKLEPKPQELITDRMQELMDRRKAKQPINHPSAGSIFKRPGKNIYAAALIEECGLKGFSIGGAEVSTKHSGFIVNDHNATAKDVKALIEHIQKIVLEQKGIKLCCEVKFIG